MIVERVKAGLSQHGVRESGSGVVRSVRMSSSASREQLATGAGILKRRKPSASEPERCIGSNERRRL